jgi:3-carboxy-cis,cis-muconate cycloisomerase
VERSAAGPERDGFLRLLSLELVFSDPQTAEAFSDEQLLAAMARFEAALAQASDGFVPREHAATIAKACAGAQFDIGRLAEEARQAGTLAIPFVRALTAQVPGEAARFVHLGATSQDAIDTAVVVCLGKAAQRVLELTRLVGDAAARLAERHRDTPMVARTLLQPATPVPFGWKAAVWLSLITRAHQAFQRAARDASVLQFGGAAGTLAAFGVEGDAVADKLAGALGLRRAPITWHGGRDLFARVGVEAAILAGAAGKIARDVALLMQAEVGEAFEPAGQGRGTSSAMPHKRNPAASLLALEAAQRAPGLAATLLAQLTPEHERGLGQWQSQWTTLKEVFGCAASALAAMAPVLDGLEVSSAAMAANLERTRGLVFSEALALHLGKTRGKAAAHALTEKLCAQAVHENRNLREVAKAVVPAEELEALFDARRSFAGAHAMIERALATWRERAP